MHSLSVSYNREGGSDLHTLVTGGALKSIVVDNSGIDPEERGGTAKHLLGSAVLYCYCAALDKALATRGVEYAAIDGTATLETGTDELKRARVMKITLDVTVTMDEDMEDIFERVAKIMRNGCLVSASLEGGIEIVYNLQMKAA
ncbi:OsmC family protein [Desulfovibrio sp. OttesenSCG-928-C06]|nr:OsmC family protein [Desulfovibrio sp. OttesenSCG-928-C06]